MKPHLLRTMARWVSVFSLFVVVATLAGCSADQPTSKQLAFKGATYSSADGKTVITMISASELEIAKEGVNLVCAYTKQGDLVRAVVNSKGTTQSVYYRIVPEGLRDNGGRLLYNPEALEALRQQAAQAAEAKMRELARKRALLVGRWQPTNQQAESMGVMSYAADGTWFSQGQSKSKGRWTIDNENTLTEITTELRGNPNYSYTSRSHIIELSQETFVFNFSGGISKYARIK